MYSYRIINLKIIIAIFLAPLLFIGCSKRSTTKLKDPRQQVIEDARKNIGVGYCLGGKDPKRCFDCSGFTQYIFQKQGIKLPNSALEQFASGKSISKHMAKPADLIFFKGADKKSKSAGHVGIVVSTEPNDIQFIHASTSKGIILSRLSENYFKERFLGIRRYIP